MSTATIVSRCLALDFVGFFFRYCGLGEGWIPSAHDEAEFLCCGLQVRKKTKYQILQ
jgi:hypothetical protein